MSDLNNLPFKSDGSSNDSFKAEPVEAPEVDPFSVLGKTKNENPPLVIRYQNWPTLSACSIEIPEKPLITAIKNDRPVVIWFCNDANEIWATRWDDRHEIKHHVIGRRHLPHFKSCPSYIRAQSPDGFWMSVCRISFSEFVELSEFPDEKTKIKLINKTNHLTQK